MYCELQKILQSELKISSKLYLGKWDKYEKSSNFGKWDKNYTYLSIKFHDYEPLITPCDFY